MNMRNAHVFRTTLGAAALSFALVGCESETTGATSGPCSSDSDCASDYVCAGAGARGSEGVCAPIDGGGTETCGGRGVVCAAGETCVDGMCQSPGGTTCACNTDCAVGEACLGGICGTPIGSCTTDCECAVGSTCEEGTCSGSEVSPCDGVTCAAGEECNPTTGLCDAQSACGTCPDGATCNEETGECETESTGDGTPCSPCLVDGDCGGAADECVSLTDGDYCGQACAVISDCPSGYACVEGVGQCYPLGGICDGCMLTGCGPDEDCNPTTLQCESNECQLTAADCTGTVGVFDEVNCQCVGCLEDTDCGPGGVCEETNACQGGGGIACTRIADCPSNQICDTRVGYCVDCLSQGDCAGDDICLGGFCEPCPCPAGSVCDVNGNCQNVDPSVCSTDADCVRIAQQLGGDGANAFCDPSIGCYTAGVCNGSLLALPGLDLGDMLGLETTEDVFNAACPSGTVCETTSDLTSLLLNGGVVEFACVGCDTSNPDACRLGESCLDGSGLLSEEPIYSCQPDNSGCIEIIPGFPICP